MAEDNVQANIRIGIDTSDALASIKNLQRQISAFHTSMANGSAANAAAAANFQKTLIDNVNATKKFSASIQTVRTTTETFTNALEKNKLSMGQYFRYAAGASKSFGRFFATEFETINKVARERVKDLQTQYIKMGRDANGAMRAIAVRPLVLDMDNLATKTAIAAQRQQLLNQLLKQGSTNLLNFGKNTQWAGRQLMVGFTIPLSIFGSTAAKSFMTIEDQAIRFRRVYGDLMTDTGQTEAMLNSIKELASEFTKYGVAVDKTMGLAASAAAQGKTGADLTAQVAQATRLSVLGQVEQQQALETTISVTNAFGVAAGDLASKIDFLNAVENQTVTSIEDLTIAIPKAGPVVKQLGGDVEDLAFFLTAMKEGGINASEGANALKSGLASLINPTEKASEMLAGFGINIRGIVESNKGDVKGIVTDFATSLDKLDPLKRARAIEQLFGKFQFSRLSTLFQNVIGEGTQAQKVLELAATSSEGLAALSERELGKISESSMFKFKKSIEDIKVALAPIGETFLKLATPVIEFGTKILNAFNSLDERTKNFVAGLVGVVGGIGPILLMTFGLLANGIANIIKGFTFVKNVFNRASVSSNDLGSQISYMTSEQLKAAAVAASLDQVHGKLTQTFTAEASAIGAYVSALQKANTAAAAFNVPVVGRSRPVQKLSSGGFVSGSGNGDTVPAMLTPGEFVVKKKSAQKVMPLLQAINSGKISRFSEGGEVGKPKNIVSLFAEYALRLQNSRENMSRQSGRTSSEEVLAPLSMRIGEARGIVPSQSQVSKGSFDPIADEYESIVKKFTDRLNENFETTFSHIEDVNERYSKAWTAAGQAVEKEVNDIKSDTDRGVVRKTFGLDEDVYGTMPTMPRREGGTRLERARKSAFKLKDTGIRSYTSILAGARALMSRRTGQDTSDRQMGHVFEPVTTELSKITSDPRASNAAKKAGQLIGVNLNNQAVDGIIESTDQASPSRKAKKVGENIGIGAIQGIESTIDEAKAVGRKSRRVQGIPTANGGMSIVPVIAQTSQAEAFANTPQSRVPRRASREGDLQARQAQEALARNSTDASDAVDGMTKTAKQSRISMLGLNNALSATSLGLSAASGAAMMFGNANNKAVTAINAVSTGLFGISSVMQMFGGGSLQSFLGDRMKKGQIGVRAANVFGGGILGGGAKAGASGALKGFAGMLGKAAIFVRGFLGPVGLAITAVTAFAAIIKFAIDAREEERRKIEGLGDAALLTKDKLQTLGSIFGVTPTQSPLERATLAAPMKVSDRQQVDVVRSSQEFKDKFAKDIKSLSEATAAEAQVALESIAVQLEGSGFAKEQIGQIILALQEESKQTSFKLDFKTISLNTKTGQGLIKKNASILAKGFSEGFSDGMQQQWTRTGGRGGLTAATKTLIPTKEFEKEISTTSKTFAGLFSGISNAFATGVIDSKEFESSLANVTSAIESIPAPQQLTLMNSILGNMDSPLAKAAQGVSNLKDKYLLLQAAMLGVNTLTEGELKVLQNGPNSTDGGAQRAYSRVKGKLIKEIKSFKEIYDSLAKEMAGEGDGGDADGDGEKSKYQKAIDQITEKTMAILYQTKAFNNLKKAGYETEEAFKIAEDPILAAALATTKVGTKEWKALTSAIKNSKKAAEDFKKIQSQTIAGATEDFEKAYGNVTESFSALEENLQLAFNKANKADLDLISSSESQIAALSYSIDDYNAALDEIQLQEDEINKRYDKRIDALDKVQTINEEISRQQKSQLSIADALSQGDIAAAAKAIQDARSEDAQASLDAQKTNLENARKAEIGGIRVGGKSREELEKSILGLQQQIKKIEEDSLEPAQERIRLAEEKLKKDIDSLSVAGKTKDEWTLIANNIRIAKTNTDEFVTSINAALAAAQNLQNVLAQNSAGLGPVNTWKAAGIDVAKAQKDYTNSSAAFKSSGLSASAYIKAVDRGETFGFKSAFAAANGGMVPKYFAAGGFARGTDTVPSMLTPGEFVVKRYAVQDFGVDKLKAINSGTYSGESVYNYELNVNVKSDANPDEIARTVMTQIKQIDSQRLRGNRL